MSDTPRTDAVWEAAGRGPQDGPEKWLDAVARNMERELQEVHEALDLQASESSKLRQELADAVTKHFKLVQHLARTVEIADEFWDNQKQAVLVYHHELAEELDQIKASLIRANILQPKQLTASPEAPSHE